jgi:alpha-N-arabinofuranosidase
MRFRYAPLLVFALFVCAFGPTAFAAEIRCIVKNKTINTIDDRLFGSFMERPSWGETGPESALVPGTDRLQPAVVDLLREMKIPIVRFPGGTDADFLDWRDMVSNVPGRSAARPVSVGHENNEVSNNFGYDEFFQVSKSLGWQNIIVVNFRAGLFKQLPIEEAARRAASLVAYCNAPLGAKLPPGMVDWPAVRAHNGHPEPYKVKYWQIGNETWFFQNKINELAPDDPERYYANCLLTYVRAMLAVDPDIEFIADGTKGGQLARAEMPEKIRHLVFHAYEPWAIREVERDHKQVPISSLTPTDVWYAWVATPGFTHDGLSVFDNELIPLAHQQNFKIAVTEWNWNGWWEPRNHYPTPAFAKAVGAAGFVHALMRSGDVIDIACQSMLVGSAWDIHAIGADPTGRTPPWFMPTGQLMALYANHHGSRLLALETSGVPTYRQPFKMADVHPAEKVAMLDILATANDKTLFLHVINRDFEKDQRLSADVADFGSVTGIARCYSLTGRLKKRPEENEPAQISRIGETSFPVKSGRLSLSLPARSVSSIEIPLSR